MITYRKAEQKDIQEFIEMEKEFCKFNNESGFNKHLKPINYKNISESFLINYFNDASSPDKFFYVAEEDNNVIGYIEAEIVDLYEKDLYEITKTGHIDSLFVIDKYRNKGVGTGLVNEAIKWIKSKDVQICTLGVMYGDNGSNTSISMYEKLGFNKERVKMWKEV